MTHYQETTPGHLEADAKLPASFNVKAVMRPDILRNIRAVRPGIGTTLRHWGPGQHHDGTWEQRKQRAREYFQTFIDESFKTQYAAHVTVVQAYNEIWANSQDAAERASWTEQDRAFAAVWNSEYRNQLQQYRPAGSEPIRLALSSAAVGNDFPKAIGELAIAEDCYVAYHPYIAVYKPPTSLAALAPATARAAFHPMEGVDPTPYQITIDDSDGGLLSLAPGAAVAPGQRSDGDWRWCSGRWHYMEQAWGIKPKWLFTECGPCRDVSGSLSLDPLGGWRSIWGDGGAAQMLAMLSAWLDDVRGTAAFAEKRIGGFHLFTTPGSPPWAGFAFRQPELNQVTDLIAAKWKPVAPPPPPPPPDPEPRKYAKEAHLIPANLPRRLRIAIMDEADKQKQTVLKSADDWALTAKTALVEITARTLHLWNVEQILNRPEAEARAAIEEFVATYYPEPAPAFVYHRIGNLFTADKWQFPLGTAAERASGIIPPGGWFDATGFLTRYQLGNGFAIHTGNDYNLNIPTFDMDRNKPVYPMAAGKVTFAGIPTPGWSGVVIVRHQLPDGKFMYSRYGHLQPDELFVQKEDWVKLDDILGLTGRNMTSLGPGPFHLHLDLGITNVLLNDPGHWPGDNAAEVLKHYIDPAAWLKEHA